MPYDYSKLKNKEFPQSGGKDFRDTSVVSGEAPDGMMGQNNNSTDQYTIGKPNIGGKGGNANAGSEGS